VRIERMVGEGDLVAIHWSTSGKWSDPESPQRDGRQISIPSMTFLRMADGKISEVWNIWDGSTLETQLAANAESAGHAVT
jgi:predicted ester cyclase